MELYHGSNIIIESPNLKYSRRELDFGLGFYTTTNYEQAKEFAEKVVHRKGGEKIVNIYELDNYILKIVKILNFKKPNKNWLKFVSDNRNAIPLKDTYDIVVGPVANDDVFRTLLLYFSGELNINDTLKRLKIKKLYNQFVFKNDIVLNKLKFIRADII